MNGTIAKETSRRFYPSEIFPSRDTAADVGWRETPPVSSISWFLNQDFPPLGQYLKP
jgi:hypothetical protein